VPFPSAAPALLNDRFNAALANGVLGAVPKLLAERRAESASRLGLLGGLADLHQPLSRLGIVGGLADLGDQPSPTPGGLDRLSLAVTSSMNNPSVPFLNDPWIGPAPGVFPASVDHDPFNDSWAGGIPADRNTYRALPQSSFAPLAPLQSPLGTGDPPSSMSSGAAPGLPESSGVPTPPSHSMPSNRSPAPWGPRAPGPGAANPDQIDPGLAVSGLPLSKSGVPFVPPVPYLPQYPTPSLSQHPWLDLARSFAPNIVDYFTNTLPAPPFPATPGKIPSQDPDGLGALLESATFLPSPAFAGKAAVLPLVTLLARFSRIMEEASPGTAARIIGAAGAGPLAAQTVDRAMLLRVQAALSQAGDDVLAQIGREIAPGNPPAIVGRYGDLSGRLPPGIQAHHYGQNSVFGWDAGKGLFVPRKQGLALGLRGNALSEPYSPHSFTHQYLDGSLWDQFRDGGSRLDQLPPNLEYATAGRRSLLVGAVSPAQAADIEGEWLADLPTYGLRATDPVPRIPRPIFRLPR
jgi:hypothetical protein